MREKKKKMHPAKRKRIALWSTFFVLALAFALPLTSYTVHWVGMTANAQDASSAVNPRSGFWRAIRQGQEGYSAVKGEGANVLVQEGALEWRSFRDSNPWLNKLPWAIVGMAVLLLLYHLFHGKNKLDADRLSGRKVPRWNFFERLVHWVTAISFIALAITGLSMLLGKKLLIPVLGKAGFAAWAGMSISIHNVVGPIFTVGIVLMIVMWIWHNFPTGTDVKWFLKGGGLFTKSHPSAGRMNGGEKVWFWILATVGLAVCITGIVLVSVIYPQVQIPGVQFLRSDMQQASIIHAIAGIIWTTVALGHIYIGTAGTQGAFEGMSTGYVSEEWAQQHHDLWYDKMAAKGKVLEAGAAPGSQLGTVYGKTPLHEPPN